MTKETGTLKELNVKAGDVVECVKSVGDFTPGNEYTITREGWIADDDGVIWGPGRILHYPIGSTFRIVSRADDTLKIWCDMTPEEKSAIWLGFYQGKQVQYCKPGLKWTKDTDFDPDNPGHDIDLAYRIKPEPVRETTNITIWCDEYDYQLGRGTIDLIDGKPDPDSIRMKPLD
jgi:hypothetical protein